MLATQDLVGEKHSYITCIIKLHYNYNCLVTCPETLYEMERSDDQSYESNVVTVTLPQQNYHKSWTNLRHDREWAWALNIARHSAVCSFHTRTTLWGPVWPDASSVVKPLRHKHDTYQWHQSQQLQQRKYNTISSLPTKYLRPCPYISEQENATKNDGPCSEIKPKLVANFAKNRVSQTVITMMNLKCRTVHKHVINGCCISWNIFFGW